MFDQFDPSHFASEVIRSEVCESQESKRPCYAPFNSSCGEVQAGTARIGDGGPPDRLGNHMKLPRL